MNIPRDKILHFVYGAMICFVAGSVSSLFGFPQYAASIGLIFGVAAGIVKEVMDLGISGTPEWLDLFATALGAFLAAVALAAAHT